MKKFLFRKPPEVFALFISIPLMLYIVYSYFFGFEINTAIVCLIIVESFIMFHIYTLVRELNPTLRYPHELVTELKYHNNTDYDCADIELPHLRSWYLLSKELNMPELEMTFRGLIDDYFLNQKIRSSEKQDNEDDGDGDILV